MAGHWFQLEAKNTQCNTGTAKARFLLGFPPPSEKLALKTGPRKWLFD